MRNKTLIILGMHRSGTSLITQWLHSCGLEVGENLLGAGPGNVEGHFEDTEFNKIHMEILRDNNQNDSGIITDPASKLSPYHKEKLKAIIAVKNRLYNHWGWKDPRTCLFLDYYNDILPDAHYLVTTRDYQSVITSLLKRNFAVFDAYYDAKKGSLSRFKWYKLRREREFKKYCELHSSFFLQVWIHYNEKILRTIKNLPPDRYLIINYLMLNTMDKDIISYINHHWHFSLDYTKFADIYKENLLSKPFDVMAYITDQELIKKADDLMLELNAFTLVEALKNGSKASRQKVLAKV